MKNVFLCGIGLSLGILSLCSGCQTTSQERSDGRSMLDVSDQELLDAYWTGRSSKVRVGNASVVWSWNIVDQILFLAHHVQLEGDLETRVDQLQSTLDTLWDEMDEDPKLKNPNRELRLFLGLSVQDDIKKLDPDLNRVFDPIVTFRNGRELITVSDVDIEGNRIIMKFPGGRGKIDAVLNQKNELVGQWSVGNELEPLEESEFVARPRELDICMTHGPRISQDKIDELDGEWMLKFEQLGKARCSIALLSSNPNQYTGDGMYGDDFHYFPDEYTHMIIDIEFQNGRIQNLVGRAAYSDLPDSESVVNLLISYFDGEHWVSMKAELDQNGKLVGEVDSTRYGQQKWTGQKLSPDQSDGLN